MRLQALQDALLVASLFFALIQFGYAAPSSQEDARARAIGSSALVAYEAGNTAKAAQLYLQAAKLGNANAQYNIAAMQFGGDTKLISRAQAMFYLEQSAGANYAYAQEMLGRVIEAKDPIRAHRLFLIAAEQGVVDAQLQLASQYLLGRGTSQNDEQAACWFERAANAGDAGAQATIASFYEKGIGVVKDWSTAISWYALAARQGDTVAGIQAKVLSERLAKGEAAL